jgi:hypothetical protein
MGRCVAQRDTLAEAEPQIGDLVPPPDRARRLLVDGR